MKVTREQATQNRERVVETAARLFRERGFDGIGISDLMKQVGLTHGGFYAQFPSKEHLMAEATASAAKHREDALGRLIAAHPEKGIAGFVEMYLSMGHRDNPGEGCYMATLGIDAARQGPLIREAFTKAVRGAIEHLAMFEDESTVKERRRKAVADYAAMIGAMVVARAVSDESLSEEILSSVKAELVNRAAATRKPRRQGQS